MIRPKDGENGPVAQNNVGLLAFSVRLGHF